MSSAHTKKKSPRSRGPSPLPYDGKPTVILHFDRDIFRMNLQGLPMFLFSPLKVVRRYNMDRIHLYGQPRKAPASATGKAPASATGKAPASATGKAPASAIGKPIGLAGIHGMTRLMRGRRGGGKSTTRRRRGKKT